MASTTTSLINHSFGGIRRKDSMFSDEKITCSDCQNVELFYTDLNSAIGLRTAKGNVSVGATIPDGEEVVGLFETVQNNVLHYIVYTESISAGKLYELNISTKELTALTLPNNNAPLTVTGKCQAENFTQGWLDVMVFSNGVEIIFIYTDTQNNSSLYIAGANDGSAANKLSVTLQDTDGRTVKGLGLVNFDKRLWVFNGTTIWYSHQENIANFHNEQSDLTKNTRAGYIERPKTITAIHEYLGSIAVFHKDSSALITQDSTTLFKVGDDSPGGCASYNSLVFHGTDLFFYDNNKKGVFAFQQVVNGDKTLSDNIAYDIQEELMKIDKTKLHLIRTLSVVTSDRNEVWFLLPISSTYDVDGVTKNASIVMIYDYIRGEWVKRKCQHINAIAVIDNMLFSAGDEIYQEYITSNFNGNYIDNYYQCTIMNMGTDNTLKITKFPPRLTIDASFVNHFFVKYVKNYNITKKPKIKELFSKSFGNVLTYDSNQRWDSGRTYKPGTISGIIKMPSATFKALEITFYTTAPDQEFVIKSF